MTRITRLLAFTCASLLVAATIGVSAALAAPVSKWESVAYNLGKSADTPVLLVSGVLPDSAKLPATVELAAPAGSTLQWVGEILGGDAAADPEVATTKTQRNGQDIYTFTLTKSRTAQLEVGAASAVTVNGDVYTVAFSEPVWADMADASVAIQIPVTARLTEPATGTASLAPGPTGFQYYQKQFTNVKNGDPLTANFSYTLAAAPAGAAATGPGTGGTIVPILLAAIAAALGVGLVLGVRRKLRGDESERAEVPARRTRSQASSAAPSPQIAEQFDVADDDTHDAAADDGLEIDDGADDADATPEKPKMSLAVIGTLIIIALAIAAGVIAAAQGGQAKSVGTTISKTFSGGEACTNATIPLAFPQGADNADSAEQLLGALTAVPSITVATVDLAASTISVGYCESQTNEDVIRQALAPTGYVAMGNVTTPAGTTGGAAATPTATE